MKRWAWSIFCLFSLLVFLSSVTIWVRSHFVRDAIDHWSGKLDEAGAISARGATYYGAMTGEGAIWLNRDHFDTDGELDGPLGWYYCTLPPPPGSNSPRSRYWSDDFQLAGLNFAHAFIPAPNGGRSMQQLRLPLWLFLPAGVPPFLWWRKWRKKGGRGFPVSVSVTAENAKTN